VLPSYPGIITATRSTARRFLQAGAVARRGALHMGAVAAMLLIPSTASRARDLYAWSGNVALAPFDDSRQQGETALVTDSNGRVWLSFIDAQYKQGPRGDWLAWPRALRLFVSADGAKSFTAELVDRSSRRRGAGGRPVGPSLREAS
jgi:hypothetical protein